MSQYIQWPGKITSVNGVTGALTLVAGSNITITTLGQNITIAASGGGGGSGFDTIGTFDTGVASADGLNASGTTLFAQSASATLPGMVNTTAQTFAGDKTFNDHIVNTSLTASRAMVTSGGSILTTSATTATELGYVSGVTSAIQTQLDAKQATGNYITALTGDGTAAGPGSSALTLATVNSNVGSFTYGSFTVNAKGLVTAASSGTTPVTSVALSVPGTSIFGVTGSPVTTTGTLGLTTTGTSGGIPYFSSTSALSSSALLTANALVLGGGAGSAPVALGSLGTTSTVLHGNAAGAPTFGAVALATDVSGTLAVGNGGTGQVTAAAAITALAGTQAAGKVLRSDGTNTTLQYPEPIIGSKTSNYTTVANDNLLKGDSSGGAFQFTLLAAATAGSGKRYIFIKTDSSLTAITVSDGTFSTTLNTQGESIEVYTDGSSWFLSQRYIPSVWTSYTPTYVGLGTVTSITAQWKRIGDSIVINARQTTGTVTATVASISLPVTTESTVFSAATIIGTAYSNATTTNPISVLSVSGGSTLNFGLGTNSSAALTAQNGNGFITNTTAFALSTTPLKVSGWNG